MNGNRLELGFLLVVTVLSAGMALRARSFSSAEAELPQLAGVITIVTAGLIVAQQRTGIFERQPRQDSDVADSDTGGEGEEGSPDFSVAGDARSPESTEDTHSPESTEDDRSPESTEDAHSPESEMDVSTTRQKDWTYMTPQATTALTLLAYVVLGYLVGLLWPTPVVFLLYGRWAGLPWKHTVGLVVLTTGSVLLFGVLFGVPVESGILTGREGIR